MIYLPDENVCIVLVPKTGTTSIRSMFLHKPHKRITVNDNDHTDVQTALDNKLLPETTNFMGFIREPLERQLSLYMYRHRQRRYRNERISPEDFWNRMGSGCLRDKPYNMQLQSTFMEYNGINIGTWYIYEDLERVMSKYGRVPFLNRSSNHNTKDLMLEFYSNNDVKKAAEKYWQKDIELYERIKHESIDGISKLTDDDGTCNQRRSL